MSIFNGKQVLITGASGSFGKQFVKTVLEKHPGIKKLVVFSRDELKQFEMAQIFCPTKYPQMRYFLGDVRDRDRLESALEGIDIVIHAAALKQVPAAEYNPFECIKTNVLGAQNLIEACLAKGVKRVVALSTDKAAAPINLYGATKLCSDKLFIAAMNMVGTRDLKFSVVRYGNVMGSRGSVIPFFMSRRATGVLPITHKDMTRFNISLEDGVSLVFHALEHSLGGEIYVPKIPSYRITELAEAIGPECEKPIVGIRPGEKLHEEMITESDAQNTIDTPKNYIIVPNSTSGSMDEQLKLYCKHHGGTLVEPTFRYSSGENDEWLDVAAIRSLIREHVDTGFELK